MHQALAALEWQQVLQLVASFARTGAGRDLVLNTAPAFGPGAFRAYGLARDMAQLLARFGTLPLSSLEGLSLLRAPEGGWSPQELLELVALVRTVEEVRQAVLASSPGPFLGELVAELPNLSGFLAWCQARLDEEGHILDAASPALAQARRNRERLRQALQQELDSLARQMPFASGPFTLRRDRYCFPIPATERGKVQGLVLDASGSGATLFVEPFSLVELNNALAQAQAQIREEEERILGELRAAFLARRQQLLAAGQVLATLDAFQARVLFGRHAQARLLPPGEGEVFRVVEARHPLLDHELAPLREKVLGEAGNRQPVVPTTLEFPPEVRVVLISGPNAGGKTVALKTIGLLVLMVAAGIPVLAEEGTKLPEVSGVFCHIGDEQNVLAELSTFQAAMTATASLLGRTDPSPLVLYDELGSGTDPEEGQALGAALLEELASRRWWTLATSHLLGLAVHVENLPGAANAAMGFDEQSRRPTYRLTLGNPGRSRGLALARACGLPETLLRRAEALLSGAYVSLDRYLAKLQAEIENLQQAQRRLAVQELELKQAQKELQAQAQALAEEKQRLRQSLQGELSKLRQHAQEQWQKVMAELEAAKREGQLPGRRKLAALRSQALALSLPETTETSQEEAWEPGTAVEVQGFPGEGRVLRVLGPRLEVAIAGKRVWVESSSCRPVSPSKAQTQLTVEAAPGGQELSLLGLDREEARARLEKFLDAAFLAGARQVRIVHGHGSGTLRRMVWEVLKGHPAVVSYAHPPQYRGGTGVTEVELGS